MALGTAISSLGLLVLACGTSEPTPHVVGDCGLDGTRLESVLDEGRAALSAPAASLAVVAANGCSWVGASGETTPGGGAAARPGDLYRIGSVTKTYTAALVLLLRDEGKLSLDDRLSRYLPGYPNAADITVRMLLNHTSGVAEYLESPEFRSRASDPWDPVEIVDIAAGMTPRFAPGTRFRYTNTNYILLGVIVGAATGSTWGAQVRKRLLQPLGLRNTYVGGEDEPAPYVRGYGVRRGKVVDVTNWIHPTGAWAAGSLIASASDVARWGEALFSGRVIRRESLREMVKPSNLPDGGSAYGLGMGVGKDRDGPLWFHAGNITGYGAALMYDPRRGAVAAALANLDGADAMRLAKAALRTVGR